jgi:hypothetical protein
MTISMEEIKTLVRAVIDRQVATTGSGKLLVAHDANAVESLVRNIVGNLTMALDEALQSDDELAATEVASVG